MLSSIFFLVLVIFLINECVSSLDLFYPPPNVPLCCYSCAFLLYIPIGSRGRGLWFMCATTSQPTALHLICLKTGFLSFHTHFCPLHVCFMALHAMVCRISASYIQSVCMVARYCHPNRATVLFSVFQMWFSHPTPPSPPPPQCIYSVLVWWSRWLNGPFYCPYFWFTPYVRRSARVRT